MLEEEIVNIEPHITSADDVIKNKKKYNLRLKFEYLEQRKHQGRIEVKHK